MVWTKNRGCNDLRHGNDPLEEWKVILGTNLGRRLQTKSGEWIRDQIIRMDFVKARNPLKEHKQEGRIEKCIIRWLISAEKGFQRQKKEDLLGRTLLLVHKKDEVSLVGILAEELLVHKHSDLFVRENQLSSGFTDRAARRKMSILKGFSGFQSVQLY